MAKTLRHYQHWKSISLFQLQRTFSLLQCWSPTRKLFFLPSPRYEFLPVRIIGRHFSSHKFAVKIFRRSAYNLSRIRLSKCLIMVKSDRAESVRKCLFDSKIQKQFYKLKNRNFVQTRSTFFIKSNNMLRETSFLLTTGLDSAKTLCPWSVQMADLFLGEP